VIALKISQEKRSLIVKVESTRPLGRAKRAAIAHTISSMVRIEESYDEFYTEARKHREFHWVVKHGAGRLLRAQTVFEDVVKMICTTNCSWELTRVMAKNLTTKLGRQKGDAGCSFPSPEAIAGKTDSFLRKEIHSGYRSPYLLEFAERVASGKLSVEQWRHSSQPTEELFKEARAVKGMGDYAAGNIMKLLGRYDYLGLDSWCRAKFCEMHKNGRRVSDRTIERHYRSFGKWQGLFLWMDLTREWHEKEPPF
jgi:3-methyladenine DNA glycosylase/8-oxoguanine DNA glycosylase